MLELRTRHKSGNDLEKRASGSSNLSDPIYYLNSQGYGINMKTRTVTISVEEYERLKKIEKVDKSMLEDIARGIKDILSGRVKEV